MNDKFTDEARKTLQLANEEARRFNHEYVGTEHILLGLFKHGDNRGIEVLKDLEIDIGKLRAETERILYTDPDVPTPSKLPHTSRAKRVVEYGIKEARNLGHKEVGTEHLLLGLMCEKEGVAFKVLTSLGIRLWDVQEAVLNLHSRRSSPLSRIAPCKCV